MTFSFFSLFFLENLPFKRRSMYSSLKRYIWILADGQWNIPSLWLDVRSLFTDFAWREQAFSSRSCFDVLSPYNRSPLDTIALRAVDASRSNRPSINFSFSRHFVDGRRIMARIREIRQIQKDREKGKETGKSRSSSFSSWRPEWWIVWYRA